MGRFLIKYFTFALDVQLGPTEFAVTISKHSNKKAAIYNSKMANQINFDQMTLKRNVEGSVEQQWTNATKAFKLVGLFFGQWLSRPTRDFLPVLKNCYEKIKAHSESAFEVIYVGGELNQEQNFLKQHQPWLYVPYGTGQIQFIGLQQRRTVYLHRLKDKLMRRLGLSQGARDVTERYSTASSGTRGNAFCRVEDAIQWICDRMNKLNSETLEVLEQIFEQHKLDNRDIQDFRKTAEVSAEDSYDYCELLKMMESEYQQLRELSAGRMVDLDALIAFIRAAQFELLWANQREELKMTRNWSDLERLNIRMLQNYFKQLPHEIELHEKQFNDVHNQGTALINQRHPAGEVIEVYLSTMQNQWDWMLNLSKCMESHLRDAYNAKAFVEESEQQMQQQLDHLDHEYSRTDFSLDDGEQMLRQLDFVREYIQQLHARLLSLTDRCAQISPLLQHGERISKPLPVMAFSEHKSKDKIYIRQALVCLYGTLNGTGTEEKFENKICHPDEKKCFAYKCFSNGELHYEFGCASITIPEHCNYIEKRFRATCQCSFGGLNQSLPFQIPENGSRIRRAALHSKAICTFFAFLSSVLHYCLSPFL
ncbi:hypothetical protein niasHT_001642 [Heterodera trifolii]|uniref:Thioredoxin-like fold domain-containing protein n=1 Tax=Heterodera trifolii TaxID=157864 RepID=A0ABD2M3K8_9BILA